MADDQNRLRVLQLEREILRTLCAQPQPRRTIEGLARELAAYSWREPDHGIVYKAVVQTATRGAADLRSHLAAQTTRMGFPDIDWEAFFANGETSGRPIFDLICELKSAAEGIA